MAKKEDIISRIVKNRILNIFFFIFIRWSCRIIVEIRLTYRVPKL